jgi:cell division protein FtsW
MITLYSCSNLAFGTRYLVQQASWAACGIAACLVAASIDYRAWRNWAWAPFILSFVALMLVWAPGIGMTINGSARWLNLHVGSFQPSEAAKIALILFLAWYADKYQEQMRSFWRGLVLPGSIAMVLIVPVFFEPDRGTTILMSGLTVALLVLAGVRWHYVIPPAIAGAIGMACILVTDPMRFRRILAWLDPEQYKATASGYQAWQALIALGAGGPLGAGLGNGRQKLGFLPEHHTDFIFSMVGEELGLAGTLAVLAAYAVFVICGVFIAWNARETFGLMLASGVTFLIGMQAFINIGVVTSALPNKGLALPFISYGGSSLLLMLFGVGVLLSVARHAGPSAEEEKDVSDLRTQFA